MKKWNFFLLIILCFFLFPEKTQASEINKLFPELSSTIFDSDSGLSTTEISVILQTDDDYIWVGTNSGLFRYNGKKFVKTNLDSRLNTITDLYADNHNQLWIATNNNGLGCYNLTTKKLELFTSNNGLSSNTIHCITADEDDNIYVGTSDYLSIISTDKRVHSPFSATEMTGITDLAYSASEDCIAGVTNAGKLFYFKDQKTTLASTKKLKAGEYFNCIAVSHNDKFLIGTTENAIYTSSIKNDKISYSLYLEVPDASYINKIVPNKNSKDMLICAENGALYYTINGKFINLSSDFNNSLVDAFRDKQNNFWLASSKMGVCKISSNPFSDIFLATGLESTIVSAVTKINNDLYIGCDDGLIIIEDKTYTQKTNTLTQILQGVRIRHIMQDSKQNLWISTYSTSGLYCVSPKGAVSFYNERTGTQGGKFNFTYELQDGSILASSNTGLTFIKNGKILTVIGYDSGTEIPQILCAYQHTDGSIYVGSEGNGVYIIEDFQIKERLRTPDNLENKIISRIVPANAGLLYVTTNEIYYHNIARNTIRKMETFPNNTIYDIHIYKKNIWVGSSSGIYIIPLKEMQENKEYNYILMDKNKGFDTAITPNSWNFTDSENNFYICCKDGVRKFNLNDSVMTPPKMHLGVNHVIIDNNTEIMPENETYIIPSSTTYISIEPMVLDYTLSDPLVRVYMEGFSEKGITLNKSELNDISFTKLPYGDYKFHIEILDETTHEVLQDKVINIKKEAQFFELLSFKGYFIAICLLLVAYFAWLIARMANMSIIHQQMKATQIARREAERANAAKSAFLANMSHEIRTPINAIMGINELILRQKTNPEVQKYATDIHNASTTLLAIVNDILDFSKIESGKMSIVNNHYKTEQLLQDVAAILQIRAKEKNLVSKIIFDQNIPSELFGDAIKIKQVILNLISNAVKYTDTGKVTFRVKLLSAKNDIAEIKFSVKDTGMGIKENDIKKIFEVFQRLEEKKNADIQGTGLGLSITKQLLNLMDSDIQVESTYGKGSTFSFVLKQPIINSVPIGNINTIFNVSKTESVYTPNFSAPDAKVLVVDDNEMNLIVFTGLLEMTKIQIDTASSGKQCLEMIRNKHYDIIFLDHMMPDMDGMETFSEMQTFEHLCKDIPIIILTANAIHGAKEMYLAHGFTDYLAKPVSSKLLEAMIQKHLPKELLYPVTVDYEEETTDVTTTEAESNFFNKDYVELNEIDSQYGLSLNGNLTSLYRKLVSIFYETTEEKISEILETYRSEDWTNYEVHVHALKSTAKSLGALALSNAAKGLEFAAKSSNLEYIHEYHEKVIKHYREVSAECKKILSASQTTPLIFKKATVSYTSEDTLLAIQTLKDAIHERNTKKGNEQLEILLSVAFPMRKISVLEKLQFAIGGSDWETAEKLISKL